MRIVVIGFGELGEELGRGFARAGHEVTALVRRPEVAERRAADAGVAVASEPAAVLPDADAVLSAVAAEASRSVFESALPLLGDGTVYADFASARPSEKRAAGERSAAYTDAAVLGTVVASGFAVPVVASGPGAGPLRDLAVPAGMDVTVLDAPAGHAALLKLLRSVYMKGRDALVLEMMLAARRLGLDREVAATIKGPGEEVAFPDLAERILCSLALHAGRRAEELDATGEVLAEGGVDPLVARAGAERLRRLAELGLREELGGERPADAGEVLAAVERLLGERGLR